MARPRTGGEAMTLAFPPLPDWLNELYRTLLFLPEQASRQAPPLDAFHYFQMTVMTGLAIVLGGVVVLFCLRYRRRSEGERTPLVRAPVWLEFGTYSLLLAFFIGLWVVGFGQYLDMTRAPGDAVEIYVTGKQWMWKFRYPEGAGSVETLYVPAKRPVRLLLTSRDVIHSFFVPAFRIKRDAVPGSYTRIAFEAREPGRHAILCAEMCGTGHSRMRGEVVVLPPQEWARWLEERSAPEAGDGGEGPLAARGRRVATREGCMQCHSVDGSRLLGPTWRGLFGSEVALRSGESVRADEAYLTESMMDPQAKVVADFAPAMPSYQGQLEPPEVAALVEFIKSLREAPGRAAEGRDREP